MHKRLLHLIKQSHKRTVRHNSGVDVIIINQQFSLFHTTSYPEQQNSVAVYRVPQQHAIHHSTPESVHVSAFGNRTGH
jgi:hypothetical protein